MKKYKSIKFIAGPVLKIKNVGDGFVSSVSVVDDEIINNLLSDNYELIKIIKHHSDHGTATMVVLGRE